MYVCVYIYIYTYVYVYNYIYINICMYICIYICVCVLRNSHRFVGVLPWFPAPDLKCRPDTSARRQSAIVASPALAAARDLGHRCSLRSPAT